MSAMIQTKNAFLLPTGFVIALCQEVGAIATRILLKSWGGYDVKLQLPPLTHSQRYLIAGNHQSLLDPFAIFALFPFRKRAKLLPIKFMTIPKVYHRWYIKPFAYLLGCFPAHIKERHHHTYGVSGTIKLLRYGYNIFIFPEGRRTTQAESDPKPGIVRILQEYPDVVLLLAHLEWQRNAKGKRHLLLRVAPAPADLDKTNPKAIMRAIYKV